MAGAGLNSCECLDGDHGFECLTHDWWLIIVDELDGEQLLAHDFVPIRERLIAVEALAILAPIDDICYSQSLDGGR
jgi:hypothetical protein